MANRGAYSARIIAPTLAGILASASMLLGGPAVAQTVKVGVILGYSGVSANIGQQMDKAISLYVNEHEKELPKGVQLDIIRRDTGGPRPDVAKRLAQELVTRDHVQFLAGVVFSNNALAIAPVATTAKIPLVVMNASASALTRSSPYIVRVSYTSWQKAYPLGTWAARQHYQAADTLVSDYVPGHDTEAAFSQAFTAGGGKIIAALRVPLTNPDFAPYLQRVKDSKPNVVFTFIPGGSQAIAVMKSWNSLGLKQAGTGIIGTSDLVSDDELSSMGDAPLGVVTAGPYSAAATRPQNQAFTALWRHTYGDKLVPMEAAAAAWDGMAAIFDVIKETKGKFTGDQAMQILSHWKTKDSPRGPISIDPETRDIVQNIYIRRTQKVNGHLANVEFDTIPNVKDPWKELNPAK